ncbi:MAG: type II secretion system protein [Candidatus Sericytochromatia bacterium]
MLKKKNKGFTLVEVGVASIIMLITVSGVVSTFVASMKTTRMQTATNQAQNIVQKIINDQVRNVPFNLKSITTPSDYYFKSLCGNPDVTGSIANLIKTNSITSGGNIWRKIIPLNDSIPNYSNTILTFSSNTSDTIRNELVKRYQEDLSKIAPSAHAVMEIKPLLVGGTVSAPIYSTSKVNVKVAVRWKINESLSSNTQTNYNEIVQSTIVTDNGVFINDSSKM